jgi:hypothetical protein
LREKTFNKSPQEFTMQEEENIEAPEIDKSFTTKESLVLPARMYRAWLAENFLTLYDTIDFKDIRAAVSEASDILERILKKSERATGLDLNQEVDRLAFIIAASRAFFNPNDPGPETKWTEEQLVRLADGVDGVKAKRPDIKSDIKRCAELLKMSPYKDWKLGYEQRNISPSSLRRLLPLARRVRSEKRAGNS